MSHRRVKRSRRVARAALMTAVSLDILAFALPASAQQAAADGQKAPEQPLEEVVVSSFRASLESALNRKRQSNQPIESIVPEDIGKMPDQNVAESLQHRAGRHRQDAGSERRRVAATPAGRADQSRGR